MDNLDFLCTYKKRWYISFIIIFVIILMVINMTGLSLVFQKNVLFIYFILHLYIVIFYKSKECKIYQFNKLKRELE